MNSLDAGVLKLLDDPIHVAAAAVAAFVLFLAVLYRDQVVFHLRFVGKSLSRNLLRTALTGLAIMVLVLVITLVWSVFALLDRAMEAKSRDFKAIITERWQIPSQMPFAYAADLVTGAAKNPGDYRVDPANDAMTWQFYGGTLDPTKRTRENIVFFFCMEPDKILKMMDDMDQLTEQQRADLDRACQAMQMDRRKVIIGSDKLKQMNKQVGDRITITSFNYKDIDLEVEIIGSLPHGRYGLSAFMNRAYLNESLIAYEQKNYPRKHPMAEKSLNLVWLRVPNSRVFEQVADQVERPGQFSSPAVKCETASSGIASFLEAYRDLLWGVRYLLVPAILATMALVIANAISISVRERRTEMAVLKVLGFRPGQIMTLVLAEAVAVGVVCGVVSAGATWLIINLYFGGVPFPIAFFSMFVIPSAAWWWGAAVGGLTALAGSLLPAWSARSVKVSEVFAKVA
jgi:putative ABC transport system permease protein